MCKNIKRRISIAVKTTILARQPIFNAEQKTYAYELLYRGLMEVGDDAMTATVLSNTLNSFGMDAVTNGHFIFVNISKSFLLSEFPKILPAGKTILEIKEDVSADQDVIAAMKYWKSKGLRIALDNFTSVNAQHEQLLAYADIIKINTLSYEGELAELVQTLRIHPVKILAEKVETLEQFETCQQLGFDYFQGYFFCKPLLMVNQQSFQSNNAQLLQLLSHILAAESPKELEYEIAHNLALSYKLLRYINSASVGLRQPISSIGHALALIGLDNLRVWVSMLLMSSLSQGKPDALILLSFCRGRFLEQLASKHGNKQESNDYFILGMFSLLDALLNQSVNEVIDTISLPELVRNGLLNASSEAGIRLNLIQTLEHGDWTQLDHILPSVALDDEQITAIYSEAIQWSDEKNALINSML
ncbi:MAG: EAL domain-containing protein [Mariprofundaceae bacterium]|nr:EAL domain-containing protein [Mariprofundaceae bacterium]